MLIPTAHLIVPDAPLDDTRRPIRFRRVFQAHCGGRAQLVITACGVYRAFLNGRPVGDHVLAPGWTPYQHRHLVQRFDVAELLVDGPNCLGVEVAEGWYRGRLGFGEGVTDNYGTEVGVIAELTIAGSEPASLVTDESWSWAPSAVTMASLYDGETFDQRLDEAWTVAQASVSAFRAVRVAEFDHGVLAEQSAPPVRRIEELTPVEVSVTSSGRTLVDFGQNFTGRLRVSVPAEEGLTITFRHAEVLEHGELGMRPLRNAAATDVIHTSGVGGTWEPAFTLHGFRYVDVDGWPGPIDPDALRAVVCHTDLHEIGTFRCSDERLNRLHENVRWGAKGNFVSVPTDCPQRDERLGWTGDLQVFAPTAAFLFDCRSMLASWLVDLAHEQRDADGIVPMIVPALPKLIPPIPFAGWADAAVIVPWVLHERFGDLDVLRAQYESMCRWVDTVTARSGPDGLWREFQLGDWLDPSAPPENAAQGRTDAVMVGGAYQVHVTRLLSRIAELLGHRADADRYGDQAEAQRAAFAAEYVTPNGRMMSDSPTAYALALVFDLLEPPQREAAAARLRALVEADGWHIGTGFLGTPIICDALVAAGGIDDAFKLLTQTTCPSWLYPVMMGATTVWERWDSMLPDGTINPGEMTSFNHYAFGAVGDFLHRRVAGLAPGAPGYRTLDVRPLVGGGLTAASASHVTAWGPASVAWEREGAVFTITVTVPEGCDAVVGLPDGSPDVAVGSGAHRFECPIRPAAADPVVAVT